MGRIRVLAEAPPPETAPQRSPPTNQDEVRSLDEQGRATRFEAIFAAHLDAAYDFARWLTRDPRNAEDVVQEACLRAFKSLDGFRGDNGRAWLLAIVRNTYYTWFRKSRSQWSVPFDEETMTVEGQELVDTDGPGASLERLLAQRDAKRLVNAALERLPEEFREVIVLRELEELPYKEIAAIAGIPLGTVMSRLARARKMLLAHLQQAAMES